MHLVLVEPEIPPNTGNIARLCAATRTVLHLVEPLGFELNDRSLRRAGMDYWGQVEWHRWPDWQTLVSRWGPGRCWWLIESGGPRLYTEVQYGPEDCLVFGRETAGLPRALLEAHRHAWLRIPMLNERARSLNLSNCAALVLFEALRQQGFPGAAGSLAITTPPAAARS
jgi:tRNA (cytidine/uridine-2'-O-)-methyltransferase